MASAKKRHDQLDRAIADARLAFAQRSRMERPYCDIRPVAFERAIRIIRRLELASQLKLSELIVLIFDIAASGPMLRERRSKSALQWVVERFDVPRRTAYNLLKAHGRKREGRYLWDTETMARIAHARTTRALRSTVIEARRPSTRREYLSAQRHAERQIPTIRPTILTGRALVEALRSFEQVAGSQRVWYVETLPGHPVVRDSPTGQYRCQVCEGRIEMDGAHIRHWAV